MINLNYIFYIFIILTALSFNYYYQNQEEVIFFYTLSNEDDYMLKNILEKSNTKVTVIPENTNSETLQHLKEIYDVRNVKISSIEKFTEKLGNYCIGKKTKCLYCQPKHKYYNLVNNINVVGFPFKWENKIPYSDWNYIGKYKNGLNDTQDRLRKIIDDESEDRLDNL